MEVVRQFGSKDYFAVNIKVDKVEPSLLGGIQLLLEGVILGELSDCHMLQVSLAQLNRLKDVKSPTIPESIINSSAKDIFEYIESSSDYDEFLLNLGEPFDDFIVYSFKDLEWLFFVWKLHDDPFYSYNGYPTGVCFSKVKISDYKQVILNLENYINAWVDMDGQSH